MTGFRAFAFLTAASFRNRVRLQVRRLRKPRHLVPVLAGAAYFAWLLFGQGGEGRAALAFSAPGVHFLSPAPIARRDLLQYRLLTVQLRVLFGVLLITLLSWRGVS